MQLLSDAPVEPGYHNFCKDSTFIRGNFLGKIPAHDLFIVVLGPYLYQPHILDHLQRSVDSGMAQDVTGLRVTAAILPGHQYVRARLTHSGSAGIWSTAAYFPGF